MANLKKYDPRVDSLVMEAKTLWDADVSDLTEDDRRWLADAVHAQPDEAAKLEYERSHTGFTRIITVTVADIQRLYQERLAAE